MNSQHYRCPMCKMGFLHVLPNPEHPSHYTCRSCREKFRADYRLDPENGGRVLLFAVRQNPQIEKELAAACSGDDFMDQSTSCAAKLNDLKKQGIQMELETFCLGEERAAKEKCQETFKIAKSS